MTTSTPIFEIEKSGQLTFVPMLSGALAIGHRPPLRALKRMREAGVTHVVTVLSAQEGPQPIAEAARDASLEWIWIELGSTKTLPARGKLEIKSKLEQIAAALETGARIYLHCSAGIHRTGMVAAALLFFLRHSDEEARAILAALRELTARDMGQERWEWAASFAPG